MLKLKTAVVFILRFCHDRSRVCVLSSWRPLLHTGTASSSGYLSLYLFLRPSLHHQPTSALSRIAPEVQQKLKFLFGDF